MPDINSILSGILFPADSYGQSQGPAGQPNDVSEPSSAGTSQDVFVQGRWWANLAKTKDSSAAAGEQKGGDSRLQRDAARAYANQQNSVSGETGTPPGDGTAARGNQSGDGGNSETTDAFQAGKNAEKAAITQRKPDGTALSQADLQEVEQLKTIDTKVKAHELAHLAVAGPYARGGINLQYERGPDGKNYAVGGEVSIDVSKESTPQATIDKMQVVRAAALAPADPSSQDRKVAAAATAAIGIAEQQLFLESMAQMKAKEANSLGSNTTVSTTGAASSTDATAPADKQGQSSAGVTEKAGKGLVVRFLGAPPPMGNSFAAVA